MTLKQHIAGLKKNKAGAVVLGFGVLAVLVVFVLAYQQFVGSSIDSDAGQVTQQDIERFKNAEESVEQKKAEAKSKRFERQTALKENQIVGNWDIRLKEGRALLQLKNGAYYLLIVQDNPASARRYSKGAYSYKEGLLILKPNMKLPPPKGKRYQYDILTRSDMPIAVAKSRGRLVWQIPGDDVDVYVPNYHPFLELTQDKIAIWQVLK